MKIINVLWSSHRAILADIRREVFIQEQGVPESLEWDGQDEESVHLLAIDQHGEAAGTVRLLPDGHIGRMAVRKAWRGQGIGAALLTRILELAAAQGLSRVVLNAQTSAVGFYQKAGFVIQGNEFLDAGIPHYRMERALESSSDISGGRFP